MILFTPISLYTTTYERFAFSANFGNDVARYRQIDYKMLLESPM